MIYLVETNFEADFQNGDGISCNDQIDSAWSSRELAEARIKEISRQVEWFFSKDRIAWVDASDQHKKVIRRWQPFIGWDYVGCCILEFKIDEI